MADIAGQLSSFSSGLRPALRAGIRTMRSKARARTKATERAAAKDRRAATKAQKAADRAAAKSARRAAFVERRTAARDMRAQRNASKAPCRVVYYDKESRARGWPKGARIYPSGCRVTEMVNEPGMYSRRSRSTRRRS